MTLNAPTIWNDNGITAGWQNALTRKVLDKALPPGTQLHSGTSDLLSHVPTITVQMRAAYPGMAVLVAIAAAWNGSDPTDAWNQVATMCVQLGIPELQFDLEGDGWVHVARGILQRALASVHANHPTLILTVTSYGQPLYIPNVFPPPTSTGYSNAWGPVEQEYGGVDGPTSASFYQTYWGASPPVTDWLVGYRSLARSIANEWVGKGLLYLRPGYGRGGYVQLHACVTDSLCAVAVCTDQTRWWNLGSSTSADDSGVRALWSCCALERAGYRGPNAVYDYQRDHPPLVVDGRCGPKTQASLGVVWP